MCVNVPFNHLRCKSAFLLCQQTVYQIKPMENSPQCMTYIPWKTNSMNEDTILYGDDQGQCEIIQRYGVEVVVEVVVWQGWFSVEFFTF